jgi:hypothetical protein
MAPINKIRLNTTRSSGIEEPQIGLDARIVILRASEIRLQYFDSRMREQQHQLASGERPVTVAMLVSQSPPVERSLTWYSLCEIGESLAAHPSRRSRRSLLRMRSLCFNKLTSS